MNPDLPKSENPLQDPTQEQCDPETPKSFSHEKNSLSDFAKEREKSSEKPKHRRLRKPNQTILNPDSSLWVNPVRTHGFGVWNNPRVSTSFRMDSKLAAAFKQFLIAKFGSTCRGIETIAVALLASSKVQTDIGVNPLTTSNITQIHFDPITIERNVRTRRKLVVSEEEEIREIRESYAEKLQRDKDEELEVYFSRVLADWSSIKPEAKAYHLRKAEANRHLKSAELLLELGKQEQERLTVEG